MTQGIVRSRSLKHPMKNSLRFTLTAIATAAISTISAFTPAKAALFGQTEVNQNDFIAVAAPVGSRGHQLLIIEQISDARSCWREYGSSPVKVDPLLLNFDFSGICGRSTDSNGYSIRVSGEDLGLDYSLRVVRDGNDLVLKGVPGFNSDGPEIEIGRAYGYTSDFAKIQLNPQWDFAKRTYQGRTLGHVYLATDASLSEVASGGVTPPPPDDDTPSQTYTFNDIANDIYADEIQSAVDLGFIAGFEDNTFRPQLSLTREQIVSMVAEALATLPNTNISVPSGVSFSPYPDVSASRWSAAKIQWARDNNIVSGYPDGRFRPAQPVTRAELMAVLRRAAEFGKTQQGRSAQLSATQTGVNFSDTDNHWAESLIDTMSSYCEVASPLNEVGTRFYPDSAAQRNYAAAATLRMLNCVKSD